MAFALVFALGLVGCGEKDSAQTAAQTGDGKPSPATDSPATAPASELKDLKIEDVKVGKGDPVVTGDTVWVLYTGKLANGTVFDASEKHDNKPFNLVVGAGQVIQGWDKGLLGMKIGGERNLSIPWTMGYGENGHDPIPAKSDLYFNIKLLAIVKKGEESTITAEEIKPGTGKAAGVGDKVTIEYIGTLPGGTEFESTYKAKKPVTFTIGKDEALNGIDQGVRGMKVGGVRMLTVPPLLGLPSGNEVIPPNTVLFFKVEMKKIG